MEEAGSCQHEVVVAVRLPLILEPPVLGPPHVPSDEADNVGGVLLPGPDGRKWISATFTAFPYACAGCDNPPESQSVIVVGDPDVVVEGEDGVRPDEVQGKKAVLEAVRSRPHDEELVLGKHFSQVFGHTPIDIVPQDNDLKLPK